MAWAEDGTLQFGALELDEGENDIEATAETIYARIARLHPVARLPAPAAHLELPRRRSPPATAMASATGASASAVRAASATSIRPRCRPRPRSAASTARARLQVYWLAARTPGTPLENPRQVSAYRYPRQYGPQPPSFARAMLPASPAMPLLLSGTAAVVGHESRHAESVAAQLDETLLNFDSLLGAAHAAAPGRCRRISARTRG